jgi:hypothetical protein
VNRPLKKAHLLRCAQSPHSNVLAKYASARRFLARLAPGTFLTGLWTEFFNTLVNEMYFLLKQRESYIFFADASTAGMGNSMPSPL